MKRESGTSSRRVLVLGGNRFFGKRLVERLISRGDKVTVLNRGTRQDGFENQVKRIRCDRSDSRDLHRALRGLEFDLVYDQVCYNADEAEALSRILSGSAKRLVFTSTKSVYPMGSNLREESVDTLHREIPAPGSRATLQSDYGEAKRQAESAFFQRSDFDSVVAVRFPIVFGPDDYTERLKFHVERIAAGVPIYMPSLEAQSCYVQAQDAAQVLEFLGDASYAGPINVASADPVRLGDLVTWIEAAVQVRAKIVQRPELGETSPIGVPEDWWMNTDRLRDLGVQLPLSREWLPKLISVLTKD